MLLRILFLFFLIYSHQSIYAFEGNQCQFVFLQKENVIKPSDLGPRFSSGAKRRLLNSFINKNLPKEILDQIYQILADPKVNIIETKNILWSQRAEKFKKYVPNWIKYSLTFIFGESTTVFIRKPFLMSAYKDLRDKKLRIIWNGKIELDYSDIIKTITAYRLFKLEQSQSFIQRLVQSIVPDLKNKKNIVFNHLLNLTMLEYQGIYKRPSHRFTRAFLNVLRFGRIDLWPAYEAISMQSWLSGLRISDPKVSNLAREAYSKAKEKRDLQIFFDALSPWVNGRILMNHLVAKFFKATIYMLPISAGYATYGFLNSMDYFDKHLNFNLGLDPIQDALMQDIVDQSVLTAPEDIVKELKESTEPTDGVNELLNNLEEELKNDERKSTAL